MKEQIYQELFLLHDNIRNEVSNIFMERPDCKSRCIFVLDCNDLDKEYLKFLNIKIDEMNDDSLGRLLKLIELYNKWIKDNSISYFDPENDDALDSDFVFLEELPYMFNRGVDNLIESQEWEEQ